MILFMSLFDMSKNWRHAINFVESDIRISPETVISTLHQEGFNIPISSQTFGGIFILM